ncbi:GtrA family protein [Paenibacillus gansuensis]|uniref:GtrA family protein n=1 Tax=Paenibacillus gansuensis TaxID=306542 RepID=A0ABW5PAQ0_9BACL
MIKKLAGHSFTRFLMVGVLNTMVGLGATYLFLNGIGTGYWVSTFLGNGAGAVVSYILNRRFTFQSTAHVGRSFGKFILVILVCYFVSYGVSLKLAEVVLKGLGLKETLGKELAVLIGTGIYTVINYAGHRFFTFRAPAAGTRSGVQ